MNRSVGRDEGYFLELLVYITKRHRDRVIWHDDDIPRYWIGPRQGRQPYLEHKPRPAPIAYHHFRSVATGKLPSLASLASNIRVREEERALSQPAPVDPSLHPTTPSRHHRRPREESGVEQDIAKASFVAHAASILDNKPPSWRPRRLGTFAHATQVSSDPGWLASPSPAGCVFIFICSVGGARADGESRDMEAWRRGGRHTRGVSSLDQAASGREEGGSKHSKAKPSLFHPVCSPGPMHSLSRRPRPAPPPAPSPIHHHHHPSAPPPSYYYYTSTLPVPSPRPSPRACNSCFSRSTDHAARQLSHHCPLPSIVHPTPTDFGLASQTRCAQVEACNTAALEPSRRLRPELSAARRRILSRITSPFATKSRSITDFYIQPDDPHRQYSPGDLVTGSVRLRVLRPTRVTHVVVSLHGYAQVYKNPGSPGEGFRATPGYLGTGRGKKSAEYYGNGFASLFEDELVLCGDGRLAEGAYQFNFELEFPDTDLPSSIDFERGTVSYMITATVTRPTTISPTLSCDRKVYFVERIDISPLYPPKSRTVTLEAVSRRKVARDQARKLVDPADRKSRKTDSASRSDPPRNSNSTAPSTLPESDPPMSPSPSQMSFESARSSSNRHSQVDSSSQSQGTSTNTRANDSKSSVTVKTITTQVESCVGGCLRGDSIPIKVSVNHVKHIKSMNGVIVTLFRQARVDMHPAIPLGPTEKSKNPKYEDYYPRSKTGLGGLSLSGAGSSHMFRKDLSQTVQPLIVDPGSLVSEVTVKVRVPDDAFPTISTVPGAMISFRYYVEVVVDIQGKFGAQERATQGLTGVTATTSSGGDELETVNTSNPHMVDTAPARRDKGVVSATFEVVIGTRDSERRKGKQKEEDKASSSPEQPRTGTETSNGAPPVNTTVTTPGYPTEEDYWNHSHHDWGYGSPNSHDDWYYHEYGWDQQPEVPMPYLPDNSQLSEKELARRGEERLLPSQPPGMEQQASEGAHAPSAPYIPDESVPHAYTLPTPAYESRVPSLSAPSHVTFQNHHNDMSAPAPEYFPAAGPSNHTPITMPTDDKQELQRQRLEAEASAPPLVGDNPIMEAETQPGAPVQQPSQPSAPEQLTNDEDGDDTLVPNEADFNDDSYAEANGNTGLSQDEQQSHVRDAEPHHEESRNQNESLFAAHVPPSEEIETVSTPQTAPGGSEQQRDGDVLAPSTPNANHDSQHDPLASSTAAKPSSAPTVEQ
ncbi:hypothetical protein Q7P37_002592 [Cladosporium fusiforme]